VLAEAGGRPDQDLSNLSEEEAEAQLLAELASGDDAWRRP
jgi:hypothetical protein